MELMNLTNLSKIGSKFDTDKNCSSFYSHCYTQIYDEYFQQYKNLGKKLHILEIGVAQGDDLLMIDEYFNSNCEIYGFDIDLSTCKINLNEHPNIHLYEMNGTDYESLTKFFLEKKFLFDIIIDDASHISYEILKTLFFLYDKLTNDGLYIIEDLHANYYHEKNNYEATALFFLLFFNNFYNLDNCDKCVQHIKNVNIFSNMNSNTYTSDLRPTSNIDHVSITALLQFKK